MAVLGLAGSGWYLWESRKPANAGPDEAFLQSRLVTELPAHVKLLSLKIQASEHNGTADEPEFRTRLQGTLLLTADTFVQSSVEGDAVVVAPRFKEGTEREIMGLALSKPSAGTWKTEFTFDNNPIADLGSPRTSFQAARVIVTGSAEETEFRDEQRRLRDEETQTAQSRQRQQELAEQARAEEARREANRIRAEADLESQRRAEAARLADAAAREAAAKKAQDEAESQRLREQAAAKEAAETERRQAEEAERRRRAEEPTRLIEVPARTELNIRLSTNLNSGTAKVEDRFEATTVEDLRIEGRTVVPAGSVMRGIVAAVEPATRTRRTARMTLRFDQLTVNHRTYPIRGTLTKVISGPGIKGEATRVGAGAAVGAIIGGILGGTKGALAGLAIGGGGTLAATEGKEVEVAAGTVLRVRMEEPVQIHQVQ